MKYKIGDKVRVKSLEWYNDNKDEYGYIFSHGIYFVPRMTMFCGCVMTINKIDNGSDNIIYYVKENACVWTEDMFEDDDLEFQRAVAKIVKECSCDVDYDLEFQQAIAKAVDECLWGTDDEFNENKETDTTEKLVDNSVEFDQKVLI